MDEKGFGRLWSCIALARSREQQTAGILALAGGQEAISLGI